jgi:hypothetical protein
MTELQKQLRTCKSSKRRSITSKLYPRHFSVLKLSQSPLAVSLKKKFQMPRRRVKLIRKIISSVRRRPAKFLTILNNLLKIIIACSRVTRAG